MAEFPGATVDFHHKIDDNSKEIIYKLILEKF